MKILTIAGTRPELIRLSVLLHKLPHCFDHTFVWTGQNFEANLSSNVMKELDIKPDVKLSNVSIGVMMRDFENQINIKRPDKVLVLGDTYSGLLAVIASRYGIPVYHMEAGNRCYDARVPEEANRRIIDAASTVNMPYTSNSYDNLIREGYHKNQVFKIGNPINEVMEEMPTSNKVFRSLRLMEDCYVLATLHRANNIDHPQIRDGILKALQAISEFAPVVLSVHPRLAAHDIPAGITTVPAFSFADFLHLERHALCTITDSGTVPEESALMGVPCIVTRHTTERQELVSSGHTILAGVDTDKIVHAFMNIMDVDPTTDPDYTCLDVSDRVIKILYQ